MANSPAPNYNSGGGGGRNSSAFSPAVVAIIAVLGSAFLVVSYYRIFSKLCSRWQNQRDEMDMEDHMHAAEMDGNVSPLPARGLDEALIKKIAVFSYKSGDAFTVETDCSVCLMDFSDNQELRMLPKCAHAFHVACIDTWLRTHSTCPLCRAAIWPIEVMNQYSYSPGASIFGNNSVRLPAMESDRMDYTAADGSRFNSGGHGRYPVPTLRGLLNYEDQPHHSIWIPGSFGSGDHGDDSIRLYDSRDHGGDSSSRRNSSINTAAATASSITTTPPPSINENEDSRSSTYFSTDTGPQAPLSRTASFKEPHSRSRDRDHKWRIPARRPSFRRNPFSVVRSYSMGTSRRLVHALEFLDLEDMRNSQRKSVEKLFSPHEYGITETPDFPANVTNSPAGSIASSATTHKTSGAGGSEQQVTGSSSDMKTRLPSARVSAASLQVSASDLDMRESSLKSAGSGRGRSVSFRSPFSIKRTVSGGRTLFSFRQTGRARVSSSSFGSPTSHGP